MIMMMLVMVMVTLVMAILLLLPYCLIIATIVGISSLSFNRLHFLSSISVSIVSHVLASVQVAFCKMWRKNAVKYSDERPSRKLVSRDALAQARG